MSAPDRRTRCVCGHLAGQHGGQAARTCREVGCDCRDLQKAPQARCAYCGHPAQFRRTLPDGRAICTANGCHCVEWMAQGSVNQPPGGMTRVRTVLAGREFVAEFPQVRSGEQVRLKIMPGGQMEILLSTQ